MNLGQLSGPSRRSSTLSSDGKLFSPDCIFCNKTGSKKIKSKGVWTPENVSRFEFGGGKAVQDAALPTNNQKLIAESQVWTYLLVRLFIVSHVGEIIQEIKLLEEVRMKNRENNNKNSR